MPIIVETEDLTPPAGRPASGLFVTDLDGTLLRSDRSYNAGDLAWLSRLGAAGVVRAIATGRSLFSFATLPAVDLPVDFIIFSSGAGVVEHPGGRRIRTASLEPAEVSRAFTLLSALKLDVMVHRPIPDNHLFGYRAFGPSNPDFERRLKFYAAAAFPLDTDIERFGPATQLVAIVPAERAAAALAAVERGLDGLTVIRTTSPLDGLSTWIEIFPAGVCKGRTAKWLAAKLGVPHRRTLAVGNDFNDLDLLAWAASAMVVANAPPELKERFSSVRSNNDGGVGEAIESWLKMSGGQ
jgi:hydroxymethylpyrimidine pyrophosphatase-like HAD family hydrolase